MATATFPEAADAAEVAVHGYCAPGFDAVRAAFARNFLDADV